MSYLINNEQKINDIVFANRNKNYGAYVIRSSYGNTLVKSLSIMAFGFISLMGSAYYYTNRDSKPDGKTSEFIIKDTNIITVCDLRQPEDLIKKVKPPQNQQKQNTTTSTSESTNIVDSLTNITTTVATTPVNTGLATSSVLVTDGGNTTSTGTNTATVKNDIPASGNSISQGYEVDSNPEFEGGLAALYKFVGSKLKYPLLALNENKEGTVYVKFVVDENGKVGNLNLLNSAGYGMDEEALRVVGLIPNFKTPAKVKGKAVKVYYQLPIKYKVRY